MALNTHQLDSIQPNRYSCFFRTFHVNGWFFIFRFSSRSGFLSRVRWKNLTKINTRDQRTYQKTTAVRVWSSSIDDMIQFTSKWIEIRTFKWTGKKFTQKTQMYTIFSPVSLFIIFQSKLMRCLQKNTQNWCSNPFRKVQEKIHHRKNTFRHFWFAWVYQKV